VLFVTNKVNFIALEISTRLARQGGTRLLVSQALLQIPELKISAQWPRS